MAIKVRIDFVNGLAEAEGDQSEILMVLDKVKELAPLLYEIKIHGLDANAESILMKSAYLSSPLEEEKSVANELKYFAAGLHSLDTNALKIAAIAYYQRERGYPFFSAQDMEKWYSQCGFPIPKMGYALSDAAREKHKFLKNKGRGKWMLTETGQAAIIQRLRP